MPTPRFQPARPRRAFDQIMDQVRAMLRSGELAPGDRLPSERELAEQFMVSRNTVREAMRMLEISGIVELRRGATGGAFVAKADPGRVASSMFAMFELSDFSFTDFREARAGIEAVVVRLACERMDETDIAKLEANVDKVYELTAQGRVRERAVANVEFDNILAEASGNPVLVAIVHALSEVMRELVLTLGPTEGNVVLESRRRIIGHLRERDAEAAVREIQQHIQRMHKHWVEGRYGMATFREPQVESPEGRDDVSGQ